MDFPEFKSSRTALMTELMSALPGLTVLEKAEDVKPYECDGLSAYRQLPRAVLLPRSEAELKVVLEAGNDRDGEHRLSDASWECRTHSRSALDRAGG